MEQEELERLAPVLDAIGNRTRLAVLLGLRNGEDMVAVAEHVGVTRGAVQDQVERLITLDVVYRPETSDELYALTPLGVFFAEFVTAYGDVLLEVLDEVEAAEAAAREEVEELPVGDETRERLVTERKWELVGEQMDALLEQLEFDG